MKNWNINRKIHLCVMLFFTTFAVSCTTGLRNNNLQIVEDFPVTFNLHRTTIFTENSNYNPLMMGLKDSILVVVDIENSPYFHVYKVPEFHYIGNFGTQGRGPFEFENPVFWGQFHSGESIQIWVYEMNGLKLSLIDVFGALQNSDYLAEKEYVAPPEFYESNNIMIMSDDLKVGSGAMEQGEFIISNGNEEKIGWVGFNVQYDNHLSNFLKVNSDDLDVLKQGVTKIKPDRSRFVKVHVYLPVIDVYHPDATLDFSIQLKESTDLPAFNNGVFDPQTKGWYENVFLTERYIYALNRNCELQNYHINECHHAEIHVFDWVGNAVAIYKLNEGIAQGAPFVVDEKNQKIYTINFKNSDDFFVAFDINK